MERYVLKLQVQLYISTPFSTPSHPLTHTHSPLTHTHRSQVYMDWANHYLRKGHYTQTLSDLHECVQGDNLPKIIHAVGKYVESVKFMLIL